MTGDGIKLKVAESQRMMCWMNRQERLRDEDQGISILVPRGGGETIAELWDTMETWVRYPSISA